ncbi:hypothetical protein [Sorangium sp. So ce542]
MGPINKPIATKGREYAVSGMFESPRMVNPCTALGDGAPAGRITASNG